MELSTGTAAIENSRGSSKNKELNYHKNQQFHCQWIQQMKTETLIQADTGSPMLAAAWPRHRSNLSVHEPMGKEDVGQTPGEASLGHEEE